MLKSFGDSGVGSKGPNMASRPRGIICYICGREYGTKSIEIHLKSCKKMFETQEAQKPKKERRALPPEPPSFKQLMNGGKIGEQNVQSYNEEAFAHYNTESLVPCPGCARTFLPDRLEVHLRSCKPGKKHAEEREQKQQADKIGKRPKALVCYICGRQYGTTSLKIHIKQCEKMWEVEQEKKPPAERRPCPQPPQNFDDMVIGAGKSGAAIAQQYNDEAFQNFNENALEPCPNCARTFLPKSLQIHLKSCNKHYEKMKEQGKLEEGPGKRAVKVVKQPAKPTSAFLSTRQQQQPEVLQETGKFGEETGEFGGETAKFGGEVTQPVQPEQSFGQTPGQFKESKNNGDLQSKILPRKLR